MFIGCYGCCWHLMLTMMMIITLDIIMMVMLESEEFEMLSAEWRRDNAKTKQTNKQEHIAEKCTDYGLSSALFNFRLTTERTTSTNQ